MLAYMHIIIQIFIINYTYFIIGCIRVTSKIKLSFLYNSVIFIYDLLTANEVVI